MTGRKTRTKLRFQVTKIIEVLERVEGHLKYIDDLAEGQSEYINQQLPTLTFLLEEIIKTVKLFREGL